MAKLKLDGPEFQHLKDFFQKKSDAYKTHEVEAAREIAAHDGTHAYGRHGYQSGWEPQLIRAVTGVTPDQEFDPRGLGATVRRWNFTTFGHSAYGPRGEETTAGLFEDFSFEPMNTDYRTAAGTIAGAFISPMAQSEARNMANSVVGGLNTPNHVGAIWSFTKSTSLTVNNPFGAPMTSVCVIVESPNKGQPWGISIAQRDPKNYRRDSRDVVVRCIDAFFNRKTWSQIYPRLDASVRKFNQVALAKSKVAFPQIGDLFEYFDVDVLWQSSARVIFRRTYDVASKTVSAWRLITMFADTEKAGWAPSLFLSPEWKTKLKSWKMNANANDYVWTGKTCDVHRRNRQTYPVPAWA